MSWTSGDVINTQARLRRLSSSIPSSYTVYKDGSTIRAETNLSGGTDYSGSDATTVIQGAIDALGVDGGVVFIKEGTYFCTVTRTNIGGTDYDLAVRSKDNITIRGAGMNKTILKLANGEADAAISSAVISAYNWNLGGANPNTHIEIQDLTVDFNKANQAVPNNNVYHIGVMFSAVTKSSIKNVEVKNAGTWGIGLYGGADAGSKIDNILVDGCDVHGCGGGNTPNYDCGIFVSWNETKGVSIQHTYVWGNDGYGIVFEDGVSHSQIANCWVHTNLVDGIYVYGGTVGSKYLSILDNFVIDNGENVAGHGAGIHCAVNIENLKIKNNFVKENYYDGIKVLSQTSGKIKDVQITGNTLVNNNLHTVHETYYGAISVMGTDATQNVFKAIVTDNVAYDDQGAKTQEFGLRDNAFVDYLIFKDNEFMDNIHAVYSDALSATHRTVRDNKGFAHDSLSVSFVDGSDAQDSGFEIDLAAEYARAYIVLPEQVNTVSEIRIYARSVVLEADAMRLEILINAGADNEAYNAETIAVADKPSTSTNFAANDIIYWTLTSADDADIGDLTRGDSLEIKVLHEAAGGDDCETDAFFRSIEITYS